METVEEYLKRGGVIQQIPRGVTTNNPSDMADSAQEDYRKRQRGIEGLSRKPKDIEDLV